MHKDVLCAESDFFARCLTEGTPESESKQVELLHDRPEAFGLILNYLYDSAFRSKAPSTPPSTLDSLIHAWLLADRLLMESGQNAMMDVIQAVIVKASTDKNMVLQGLSTLQLMDIKPNRTSCLHRFLVDRYACDMQNMQAHLTPRPEARLTSEAATFFECGGGIVVDVFNAFTLCMDNSWTTSDPAFGRGCTYHEHKDGSEKACWRYKNAATTPKPSKSVGGGFGPFAVNNTGGGLFSNVNAANVASGTAAFSFGRDNTTATAQGSGALGSK